MFMLNNRWQPCTIEGIHVGGRLVSFLEMWSTLRFSVFKVTDQLLHQSEACSKSSCSCSQLEGEVICGINNNNNNNSNTWSILRQQIVVSCQCRTLRVTRYVVFLMVAELALTHFILIFCTPGGDIPSFLSPRDHLENYVFVAFTN